MLIKCRNRIIVLSRRQKVFIFILSYAVGCCGRSIYYYYDDGKTDAVIIMHVIIILFVATAYLKDVCSMKKMMHVNFIERMTTTN